MRFLVSILVLFSASVSCLTIVDHARQHHGMLQYERQSRGPILDGLLIEPSVLTTFKVDPSISEEPQLLLQLGDNFLIEHEQELEHELEQIMAHAQLQDQGLMVGGDHIPTDKNLEKGIKSLTEARKVLRGSDDPVDPKSKLVIANGFLYKMDGDGRPQWARGLVARKKRSPKLSDAAHQIADVMYYHSNKKDPRVGKYYHTGHIIASALGGTDTDPVNFFPQHCYSNSRGGVWWRLEMIAGHIKDALSSFKATSVCSVMITAQLDYDTKQWLWMPTEGYYFIEMNDACAKAFVAIASKVTSYTEVGKQLINELIVKHKTVKNALAAVVGDAGVDGFRFIYQWYNKYDKADPEIDKVLFKSL